MSLIRVGVFVAFFFLVAPVAAMRQQSDHVGELSMRTNLTVKVKEGSASWMHDGGNAAGSCETWCKRKVENPISGDKQCGPNKDQQCKWEDVCKWKGTKTNEPCRACPECGSIAELPKETVEDLPNCENWCAGKIGTHTCEGNDALCTWSEICNWKSGKGSCSKCAECSAKCTLPDITSGVTSWSNPLCKSGAVVDAGTECNIIAANSYTCTSPGICDGGKFQKEGACKMKEPVENVARCENWCAVQSVKAWSEICSWNGGKGSCSKCAECNEYNAKCTLPDITSGVASWTNPLCKSGAVVDAGTECNIVAANSYTCTSPGICDGGKFQKQGACNRKEPVENLPKCENWCAGKIGTQTCQGDSAMCTWSEICSWKSGKGSCSKCAECTGKCTLPDITSGVSSWSNPSCKSGAIVDAGTECNIVAADSYVCTSPGICDGGKFRKEGACKRKEPVANLPKCEKWCAGKIGTQTCQGNTTLCTWSEICSWKNGKGSCSTCAECTAKCTLPDIRAGVASWTNPLCKSGAVVDAGTECNIVAANSHTCTSPGICDGGKFQKEGACKMKEQVENLPKCENWCAGKIGTQTCQGNTALCTWSEICGWKSGKGNCSKCTECTAKCTLPDITSGVSSWSNPSCKSGAAVDAGIECNIVAANSYTCTSPGICDGGKFQKEGACKMKEPVENLPKCENWCAGKIGTQTCKGNSAMCTWSEMCSWKSGKGSCSNCTECTAKCTLPDITSGVSSWSNPSCKSGTIVVAGTECNIVAANGYTCTSPGICDGGKFQKEGACKKEETVPTESAEMPSTTKNSGINKHMSMLVLAGALAKAMLF